MICIRIWTINIFSKQRCMRISILEWSLISMSAFISLSSDVYCAASRGGNGVICPLFDWAAPSHLEKGQQAPLENLTICIIWDLIWVRSRNCGCLVTWFCYQLIAKPGNKTATVLWPDPYKLPNFDKILTHPFTPNIDEGGGWCPSFPNPRYSIVSNLWVEWAYSFLQSCFLCHHRRDVSL